MNDDHLLVTNTKHACRIINIIITLSEYVCLFVLKSEASFISYTNHKTTTTEPP